LYKKRRHKKTEGLTVKLGLDSCLVDIGMPNVGVSVVVEKIGWPFAPAAKQAVASFWCRFTM
jgi:hypothetical protein